MKYNVGYRKLSDESVEAQAFWQSMTMGLTAQEYVNRGLALIALEEIVKANRNSQVDNSD
jgi:hypothetical protein